MSLIDLLTDTEERTQRQRMYGVATGKVQEVRDPLGLGRVKVVFPWLADDNVDAVVIDENDRRAHSYWARVATFMAGPQRGAYFIPEVGEEVLVAFEHGELDRPVIVGMLWNKEAAPPVMMDDEGKNDVRGLYTRTKHKIVLDDSADKPSILIVDQTGQNRIFIDTANKRMEIAVDGDLTIKATGNVEITAGKNITIDAAQNVDIKAKANVSVEATQAANVKANTQATFEGAAQAEVKGAAVAIKGSAMTEIQGGLVKIN